jgi:hypothetical protein
MVVALVVVPELLIVDVVMVALACLALVAVKQHDVDARGVVAAEGY